MKVFSVSRLFTVVEEFSENLLNSSELAAVHQFSIAIM
jgi:hypothetical protein